MKTLLFLTLYPFHVGAFYLSHLLRISGAENIPTPSELFALIQGGL